MNLVIALLSTRGYITAEKIRSSVAGYSDSASDEAFSRMFERDKNELRDLGIPLETGRVSSFDPIEGYRINRDAYALPAGRTDRRRGGRRRRRHPAVGVARTDHRHPGCAAQAAGRRRGRRPGRADRHRVAGRAAWDCAGRKTFSECCCRPSIPAQAVQFPHRPVPHRALHRAHRRAVGRGDRERPLVSRRARPRPRRHPHVPAVPDRRRGDTDRPGRRRHPARRTPTCARSWPTRSARRRPACGRRSGWPTGGPPRCGAPGHRWGPGSGRPRRRGHRTRHRNHRPAGARHRRLRRRRRRAGTATLRDEVLGRLRAHAGAGGERRI